MAEVRLLKQLRSETMEKRRKEAREETVQFWTKKRGGVSGKKKNKKNTTKKWRWKFYVDIILLLFCHLINKDTLLIINIVFSIKHDRAPLLLINTLIGKYFDIFNFIKKTFVI